MNRIPHKIRTAVDGAASSLVLALIFSVVITARRNGENPPELAG